MAGLQITHSGPFIPGNTTHNLTGLPRKGKPSILHYQLFILFALFPAGLQDKSFLVKLRLKWEKGVPLPPPHRSDSFKQNTCRSLLVTNPVTARTLLAKISQKVNHITLQNALNNGLFHINNTYICTREGRLTEQRSKGKRPRWAESMVDYS